MLPAREAALETGLDLCSGTAAVLAGWMIALDGPSKHVWGFVCFWTHSRQVGWIAGDLQVAASVSDHLRSFDWINHPAKHTTPTTAEVAAITPRMALLIIGTSGRE